jgi:hypothetical protein
MVKFGQHERLKVREKSMVFSSDEVMWQAFSVAAKDRRQNKVDFLRTLLAEWLLKNGYLKGGDMGV